MVAKYFSCAFLLFKNATDLLLLGIVHAAPPLAKSPLISSYSSKNFWPKLAYSLLHKMICNLFLLLVSGGCILSISPCHPLHAVGYPFGLSEHRLSNSFS